MLTFSQIVRTTYYMVETIDVCSIDDGLAVRLFLPSEIPVATGWCACPRVVSSRHEDFPFNVLLQHAIYINVLLYLRYVMYQCFLQKCLIPSVYLFSPFSIQMHRSTHHSQP